MRRLKAQPGDLVLFHVLGKVQIPFAYYYRGARRAGGDAQARLRTCSQRASWNRRCTEDLPALA